MGTGVAKGRPMLMPRPGPYDRPSGNNDKAEEEAGPVPTRPSVGMWLSDYFHLLQLPDSCNPVGRRPVLSVRCVLWQLLE